MSDREPTIDDVLREIAKLRIDMMARMDRLPDTATQHRRDIGALLDLMVASQRKVVSETHIDKIEARLGTLTWMFGFNPDATLGVLWRTLDSEMHPRHGRFAWRVERARSASLATRRSSNAAVWVHGGPVAQGSASSLN